MGVPVRPDYHCRWQADGLSQNGRHRCRSGCKTDPRERRESVWCLRNEESADFRRSGWRIRPIPDFVRKQAEIGAAQGIDRKLAEQWARMYGSNVSELFRLAKEGSDQAGGGGASGIGAGSADVCDSA